MSFDLFAALAEKGIHIPPRARASGGDVKTTCPRCSHTRRNRTDPCLSVTLDDDGGAVWQCHHCGDVGSIPGETARRRAESAGRQSSRPASGPSRPIASPPPAKVYRDPPTPAEQPRPTWLIEWFANRGISAQTIEAAGIYATRRWFPDTREECDAIALPYVWRGRVRNLKYRPRDRKAFAQEKDALPVLFGADTIAAGEDLILVEGECDVLAMREAGFTRVVSLPNGAPEKRADKGQVEAGPPRDDKRYAPLATHAEELEKVSRFLVATDCDEPGDALAEELARRLGRERCARVRFPSLGDAQVKDANETLIGHGPDVLRECVENPTFWPCEGLYTADDFAAGFWDIFDGRAPSPLSLGFGPECDKALRILPGQFVLVTGQPNHGKTRWLDQVMVQMSQQHGWRWAVFSPETMVPRHMTHLAEIHARASFYHPPIDCGPARARMSRDSAQQALDWMRQNVSFIETTTAPATIDWLLDRARAAVMRSGINAILLDPFNMIEPTRSASMTETEYIASLIGKCKAFARSTGVTVFMVAHPAKPSANGSAKVGEALDCAGAAFANAPTLYGISGSAHWANMADAGVTIWRDFERGATWAVIRKVREQPICGTQSAVRFSFDGPTRVFIEAPGSFTMPK